MKNMLAEFKAFISKGDIVLIAVGLVMALYFKAIVDQIIAGVITPIIAAIFGKPDFSALTFTINKSKFLYGDLINAILAFLSIAAAVFFFVIKPLNYVQQRRKKAMAEGAEPEPETMSDEAVLLVEIRDLLARQNG